MGGLRPKLYTPFPSFLPLFLAVKLTLLPTRTTYRRKWAKKRQEVDNRGISVTALEPLPSPSLWPCRRRATVWYGSKFLGWDLSHQVQYVRYAQQKSTTLFHKDSYFLAKLHVPQRFVVEWF